MALHSNQTCELLHSGELQLHCISPSLSYISQTAPSTMAYLQALAQNYAFSPPSFSRSFSSSRISPKPAAISCCSSATPLTLLTENIERSESDRSTVRLGLPSKGRLGNGTLELLTNCQLSVRQLNPEQYVADIPEISNLEVWFQRPKDIVRRLLSGDIDLGIVGFDKFSEYGQGDEDLIIVHDALEYGHCRLSMAVPWHGIFENINSISKLAKMPQWTSEKPLRVATGYTYLGSEFLKEKGLKHVTFSTADGALEAAPAMGTADAIIDIVSSGTTLRENNLKEIEGGAVLESQAVLVARKKSIIQQKGVLDTTREILDRLEAHLRALDQFMVTANMRGSSLEEVSERILSHPLLSGLQGPSINAIFSKPDSVTPDYYEIVICVPKRALYKSVQQLRAIGGSGVLISPLTYIFDEEPPRWRNLLMQLGL